MPIALSPAREGEYLLDTPDERNDEVDYEVSGQPPAHEDVDDGVASATPIPVPEEGECAHETAVEATDGQEEKGDDPARGSPEESTVYVTASERFRIF